MHVSHYLLLGFFSGPTPQPQPGTGAGGVDRKPKRRRQPPHRPAWVLPVQPQLQPGLQLEDDAETLLLLGVL